jgi:hypothetical protein
MKEDNNVIFSSTTALLSNTTPPYFVGSDTVLVCHAVNTSTAATFIEDDNYFEGSNDFFVGGDLFDTYSYTSATFDGVGSHKQDLDSAYQLYADSNAIGLADSNYTATDLLGVSRDTSPDAGAYEYVASEVVLLPPTDLIVDINTTTPSTILELTWTDNADNEDNYVVRWSTDNATWTAISALDANIVAYTHTGRTPNTLYYYEVYATLSGTNSTSITGNATTSDVVPVDPCDLTATKVTNANQINLVWKDNSTNETGFEIWRSLETGANFALVGTTLADVNTYSDTGLAYSEQYFYKVLATNDINDSGYTAEADATTDAQVIPPAAVDSNLVEYLSIVPLGDYEANATVTHKWRSNILSGTLKVYKGINTVPYTTITDIRGFAGLSGVNAFQINTNNAFFEIEQDYTVIAVDANSGGAIVSLPIATFSIENRNSESLTSTETANVMATVLTNSPMKTVADDTFEMLGLVDNNIEKIRSRNNNNLYGD